jgi:hypothetical protein
VTAKLNQYPAAPAGGPPGSAAALERRAWFDWRNRGLQTRGAQSSGLKPKKGSG